MHVVDHYLLPVCQRHLIATEALGGQQVVVMAELSESVGPCRALSGRHVVAVLPAGHQSVALETMVLQVQEVHIMTFEPDVAAPCVKPIVILHYDSQFLVIVEILLQEHQVVVFLHQVLANAHRARAARSFGIDVEHQNLLGQSVDVQRGNAELLRLLGLPRNSHAKRHDCRENVSFKHTYHYDLFGYQIVKYCVQR